MIVLGGAVLALLWISDGARSGFAARSALAADRCAGRDHLEPGSRERQPHVAARCLPVADIADAFAVTPAAERRAEPRRRARSLFADAAQVRPVRAPGTAGAPAAEPPPGHCRNRQHRRIPRGPSQEVVVSTSLSTPSTSPCAARPAPKAKLTPGPDGLRGPASAAPEHLFDISAISRAAVSPLIGSRNSSRRTRSCSPRRHFRLGV